MLIKKNKILNIFKKKYKIENFYKLIATIFSIFILINLYKIGIIAPIFLNGEPATIPEIMKVINNEGSKGLFDKLIAEYVISYEAKKRNIIVKKEEIEKEVNRLENKVIENGTSLLQLMKDSNQTSKKLEKDIKLRITLYKILENDIDVTEDEIDTFIEENKDMYNNKEDLEIRKEVKELLISKKSLDIYNSWVRDSYAKGNVDYYC
jgi:foldase protein PrsA